MSNSRQLGATNNASHPIDAQGITHTPTILHVSSNTAPYVQRPAVYARLDLCPVLDSFLLRDSVNFALWSKPIAFDTFHLAAKLAGTTTIPMLIYLRFAFYISSQRLPTSFPSLSQTPPKQNIPIYSTYLLLLFFLPVCTSHHIYLCAIKRCWKVLCTSASGFR